MNLDRTLLYSALALVALVLLYAGWIILIEEPRPAIAAEDHADQDVASGRHVFLAWYNGWDEYTIWGIGKVSTAVATGAVSCGGESVPVQIIFDTHVVIAEPTPVQTSEYAETYNLEVLRLLRSKGIECQFGILGEYNPAF